MKIQIVTTNTLNFENRVSISDFNHVKTFDSFDINIIDLTGEEIWRNEKKSTYESRIVNDLRSVGSLIEKSKKSKFVFVFPLNIRFYYGFYYNDYDENILLRDNIPGMVEILSNVCVINFGIEYQPNQTSIFDRDFKSDFYFNLYKNDYGKVLKSNDSCNIVAFQKGKYVYTALNILSDDGLFDFLHFFFEEEQSDVPNWLNSIDFALEKKAKQEKNNIEKRISELNDNIVALNKSISQFNKLKQILCSNGTALENVVKNCLDLLLNVHTADFVDVKEEDFSFVLKGKHYVGEIKGVTDGVKRTHLSELEDHKQKYMELNNVDNAKGLLVINYERNKTPEDRTDINPSQIEYARKNGNLIIDTRTLFKIMDAYFNKNLNIDKLINSLEDINGLLKEEWK